MNKDKLKTLVSYLRELLKTTGDKIKSRHANGLVVRIVELDRKDK